MQADLEIMLREGVIDDATAERIRAFYASRAESEATERAANKANRDQKQARIDLSQEPAHESDSTSCGLVSASP